VYCAQEVVRALITGVFATLSLAAVTAAQAVTAASGLTQTQPDHAFASKYCRIEYTADRKADARELAADADDSLDRMSSELAPLDPHLMDDFDCTIVQLGSPEPGLASDGQSHTDSWNGGQRFRVFVLARSSTSPSSRTIVKEPKDGDYVHKNIADELSSVLLERVTRAKGRGWYFQNAPDWFVQGIEGYFGLTHSTAHSRDVTLPKYIALVQSHPEQVSFANGIHVGNPYIGGLVLVTFLYDVYGSERVNVLLMSPKQTFDQAFLENFGDLDSLRKKYSEWIAAEHMPSLSK